MVLNKVESIRFDLRKTVQSGLAICVHSSCEGCYWRF
ncbi:MAG: hypothetical protein XE02_1412 [Mesotoga infera]|jgi:hypothetical protein|uniref:Uncharacterized protein n=1 Tax=Mesotoga infera TaxID=1236046 RepID=A0A101HZN9_9BACT|nr:MAG: hypothetical protein XE02_1412 [Mesotoga infera]